MKRIVLADSDHDELVITKSVIHTLPEYEIVGETTAYSLLPSLIERHQPQLVMLAMRCRIEELIPVIESIRTGIRGCPIVVLGDQPDADEMLRCFRAGADEFLYTPLDVDEWHDVVTRLERKQTADSFVEAVSKGALTLICGSRGGSGTTTVAVNLADEFSYMGKTVLVDFHFGQGDLSVFLNIQPKVTLAGIQQTHEPLDEALLESAAYPLSERLHLLLQSPNECSPLWDETDIRTLFRILCQQYEHVVVDCGTDIQWWGVVKERIHRCVLVMQQDMASLAVLKAKQERLASLGIEEACMVYAINAYTAGKVLTPSRIGMVLHRKEWVLIREDEQTAQSAINRGVPLRDVSRWSRALKDIRKAAAYLNSTSALPEIQPEQQNQIQPEQKTLAVYRRSAEIAV